MDIKSVRIKDLKEHTNSHNIILYLMLELLYNITNTGKVKEPLANTDHKYIF